MPLTNTAHKAGTTEFVAAVYRYIPLDDPEKEGNMGGVGFDDETITIGTYTTKARAKAAIRMYLRHHPEDREKFWYGDARIDEVTWERETWDDPKWGHVIDAMSVEVGGWYIYFDEHGVITGEDDFHNSY